MVHHREVREAAASPLASLHIPERLFALLRMHPDDFIRIREILEKPILDMQQELSAVRFGHRQQPELVNFLTFAF